MRIFALAFLTWLVYGPVGAAEQALAQAATHPPSRVSPFIEFTAQPQTLRSEVSPGAGATGKPKFEQVVRTPTTRFLDIRRHSPGALYECVIPEIVRNEHRNERELR